MKVLHTEHESKRRSYSEVEILIEVLGTKLSYVHGLGRSVKLLPASSFFVSSPYLLWRIEKARMEMGAMRAKQRD